MNIDGRAIATLIKEELKSKIGQVRRKLSLVVFVTKEDLATEKFIEIKKKFAEDIGIFVEVKGILNATTGELVSEIKHAAESFDGIIVQFPLKSGIDADLVRNAIPVTHDIDVISDKAVEQFERGGSPILPPVVGAIAEIVRRNNIVLKDKRMVVVGEGRLVGKPASIWARFQGMEVTTLNAQSFDTCPPKLRHRRVSNETLKADVLILGAGVPHLLKPEMIQKGVVIFDAGTSALPVPGRPREANGKLVGDADPSCALKASIFTPVPGGIGPITVAMIFKNLLMLKSLHN